MLITLSQRILLLALISVTGLPTFVWADMNLTHTAWQLQTLTGAQTPDKISVSLDFDASHFYGNDGCNRISGVYIQDSANAVRFPDDKIMSTLIGCPDAIDRFARHYLDMLRQTRTFKIEQNQLFLLNDNNRILARFSAQSTELSGTRWLINGLSNGKDGFESVTAMFLHFTSENRFSAQTACQRFNGGYQMDRQSRQLQFISMQSNDNHCPTGDKTSDTLLTEALSHVRSYRRTGNNSLQLYNEDGVLLMSLYLDSAK